MRIAIDLHACQQADTQLARDSLAAVRHLVAQPDGHSFWIAFSNHFPQRIEHLRAAFAGLLPPERILVYDLPPAAGTAREQRMIELIRENFFACLDADLVFTPGWTGPAEGAGVVTVVVDADPAATRQRALQAFKLAPRRRSSPAAPAPMPALAWIAAQAPAVSLLASLGEYYDVCLVLPEPEAASEGLPCALHTPDWFECHASGFERIVYSIRNTEQHRFMLPMLARHPGAVLLHDFFLGSLFDYTGAHQAWRKALFESHGFTGIADERALGVDAVANKYPLNKTVLELASGVIVGSNALVSDAQAWYGHGAAERWHCVPEDATGAHYADAIEAISQRSPAAHYRTLLRALRSNGSPADARHPELVNAAGAIAANQPAAAPRQLLVDVSAIVELDAKTGIARVVRSILLALISAPPQGYRVEAVYGDGGNRPYRYARQFTLALLGVGDLALEDAPIERRPGDIFLGLDVAASITVQNAALLADMRNHGVQLFFVVYDILPLLRPDMFAYGTDTYFRNYLDTITRQADGLLCNTRATADTLAEWILAHPQARPAALQIGHFHLGADLDASAPSTGLPVNAERIFAAAAQRPTLLMVGTLEPRKAHAQALAALELLWAGQIDVNLVIVGKPGWMVEPLIRKLKAHPETDLRLFWLSEASDEMLAALYGASSALLAPSLGEGFGLPLIEAARHGLPIIARRLPVFEEICGGHAFYFEGEQAQPLANAVHGWLELFRKGQAPSPVGLAWLSWAESARRLCDCVVNRHWYRSIPGTSIL